MWDPPQPVIKPVSPALQGGFLTTGPPGKPLTCYSATLGPCFFWLSPILPNKAGLDGETLHVLFYSFKICCQLVSLRWSSITKAGKGWCWLCKWKGGSIGWPTRPPLGFLRPGSQLPARVSAPARVSHLVWQVSATDGPPPSLFPLRLDFLSP